MNILRLFQKLHPLTFPCLLSATFMVGSAQADIITSGEISPDNPGSWTESTTAFIGENTSGTLEISSGATVTDYIAYVGYDAASSATVTVDGDGSTWEHTDGAYNFTGALLYLGYSGTGKLTITNGGLVTDYAAYLGVNEGSTGTVIVDGANTSWQTISDRYSGRASVERGVLHIGSAGTGTLSISNGGTVTSSSAAIGYATGAKGTVTLNGEDSTWVNSDELSVGQSGSGSLAAADGATIEAGDTSIGTDSGAEGTVSMNGEGTLWDIDGDLYIGENGSGTLSIYNGASVEDRYAYLGNASGSTGTVTINGAGSSWSAGTDIYVGGAGTGSLKVTNGGSVTGGATHIGYDTDSSGQVIVDGDDSTLELVYELYVGDSGSGTLSINNGATVINRNAYLANDASCTGSVTVQGTGSSWTSEEELTIGTYGYGTLTITDSGTVTAADDSTIIGRAAGSTGLVTISDDGLLNSAHAYVGYSADSSGTVTVKGSSAAGRWVLSSGFDIGYVGTGEVNIIENGQLTSTSASIGNYSEANGAVNIDGEGSIWNATSIQVGKNGSGNITITNGGLVSVSGHGTYIGFNSGSNGTVKVNGENSEFYNNLSLYIGYMGTGTLAVTDGGLITAADKVMTNTSSTTTVDVGSSLRIGTAEDNWSGDLTNDGTIRLVAGSGATVGTSTPLAYGTASGDGTIQALGGVWDSDGRTVTVGGAVTAQGSGGASATLDLASKQRIVVTDTNSEMAAGIGFPPSETSTKVTASITALSSNALITLKSLVTAKGESLVSAWNFSIPTESYTVSETNPVYLSLYANSADLTSLNIWHLADGQWSHFSASDLTPDGIFASFTATEAGSYAVTTTTTASASETGSTSKAMPWIPLLLLDD